MKAEAWFALGCQAVCALALVTSGLGWGSWVLGATGLGRIERSAGWRMSLGLLALGFLFFLCALIGVLTPLAVGGITLAGVGSFAYAAATTGASTNDGAPTSGWHLSRCLWGLAIAGFGAVIFALTLYPPHAFDETVYHLPIAASLGEHGEVRWLDNLRVPVFPQTAEALAGPLVRFGGAEATHLVQAVAFLALLLLLASSGHPGRGGEVSWSGRLAAAAVAGSPLFIYQATTFYVDLVLALTIAIAVLAAERFGADPAAGRGWLLVSAFAAGLAPTIKYLGVLGSVAALVLVATARRSVSGRRVGDLAVFLGVAAAVVAPTVLWLWKTTGNPVFPFLPGVFGPTGLAWLPSGADALERVVTFLSLPWTAFADRPLAGFQPPPSPWLWVALAMVALAVLNGSRRNSVGAAVRVPVFAIVILVSGFFLLFVGLGQGQGMDTRYLLPAGPLLAVAFGRVLETRLDPERRWFRPLAAVALALPGLAYGVFQLWRLGDLPLTAFEREAFLQRQHEGLRAVRQAETFSQRLYVLGNERLVGLGRGVLYGDVAGRLPASEISSLLPRPDGLAERLDDFGIGGLVILRSALPASAVPLALDAGGRFQLVFEDDQATVWQLSGDRRPPLSPSQ